MGSTRPAKTGRDLLTPPKQIKRLDAALTPDQHLPVAVTWGIYQEVIAAYRHENPATGKKLMQTVITKIATGVPAALKEIRTLGHTLNRRATDILAYFDHPHTSNGPTEATNGRLEHLRGIALGFRNLNHYILRSLLHSGGFTSQTHPGL